MFINTENNDIMTYADVKRYFSKISLPSDQNAPAVDAFLADKNIKRYSLNPEPTPDPFWIVDGSHPEFNEGTQQWEQVYDVREMTPSEVEEFKQSFYALFKNYRDLVWQQYVVTLENGAEITNDETTQNRFIKTLELIKALGEENTSINWKCNNGYFDLSPADFQEAVIKGGHVTQKAFLAEQYIIQNHESSSYSDDSWKEDFDNFMEAS